MAQLMKQTLKKPWWCPSLTLQSLTRSRSKLQPEVPVVVQFPLSLMAVASWLSFAVAVLINVSTSQFEWKCKVIEHLMGCLISSTLHSQAKTPWGLLIWAWYNSDFLVSLLCIIYPSMWSLFIQILCVSSFEISPAPVFGQMCMSRCVYPRTCAYVCVLS